MGCAKTGSGKTAAFVLPVLQKLSEDPYGVFCLVLTPTRFTSLLVYLKYSFFVSCDITISSCRSRELAYQIAEQFRAFGKPLGLKDCIIVGGMGKTGMQNICLSVLYICKMLYLVCCCFFFKTWSLRVWSCQESPMLLLLHQDDLLITSEALTPSA